ncbi:RNA polymerase sigma factor RpoE [Brackiella oedipodis]|uniref:RNA polymerase sigma factor RpoE n=1 Tax=Brackiella oedipodis TaxID=124225 RepID=UPI00048E1403|nr:RNA polymerase sigma factor RpoE [Brackiella oedipodis]
MTEANQDTLWVTQAQQGDKKAFSLLMLKYEQRILRLLSRLLRNPADAEDVAQETFIKAYTALPRFRSDSSFYTWLYRIAVNTAHNHLKKGKQNLHLSAEFANQDGETFNKINTLTDEETPETQLINQEIVQTVNQAIEQLSDELREAIVLRELEGMSYKQIADVLDCPEGTVRSRIFRAREAIAKALKPVLDTTGKQRW